jgi:predicted ATPase
MMITKFEFENYRAFIKGKFRVKPITVLVGANSVGKTSVVQLPLLLKQTANVGDKKYRAAVKLHGKEVNFGDVESIIHGKDATKPLVIAIEFRDNQLLDLIKEDIPTRFSFFLREALDALIVVKKRNPEKDPSLKAAVTISRELSKRRTHDLEKDQREKTRHLVKQIIALQSKLSVAESTELNGAPLSYHFSFFRSMYSEYGRFRFKFPLSENDLLHTLEFCDALSSISTDKFAIEVILTVQADEDKKRYLRIKEYAVQTTDKNLFFDRKLDAARTNTRADIVRIVQENGVVTSLKSDIVERKHVDLHLTEIGQRLNFKGTIFNFVDRGKISKGKFVLPSFIVELLSATIESLKKNFDPELLSHIGPLRAHPRRFYLVDTAHTGSSESELLVEALRESDELRDKVNRWLDRFGIKLEVSEIAETLHKLSVQNIGSSYTLDITDIGFGISQILPILVEGLGSGLGKVMFIEQPEIHLHPKMQAELVDLFIEIANISKSNGDKHRYLVVETHSEYFLGRLRRRIAEGAVSHNDVAVHYIEKVPGSNASTIREIEVKNDGSFEWPKDFIDLDLADTMAFFKASKSRTRSAESDVERPQARED